MKKSVILLSAIVVSLCFTSCKRTQTDQPTETPAAAANTATTDGAKIEFLETSFDFGKINEGDVVSHGFAFKNVGNAPLEILDIQVQCGCTVAAKPVGAVAVGQIDTIKVDFNSEGKPGINKKMVSVLTNGVVQPEPLSFSAEVLPRK